MSALQAHFRETHGETIGELQAGLLLDFFVKTTYFPRGKSNAGNRAPPALTLHRSMNTFQTYLKGSRLA